MTIQVTALSNDNFSVRRWSSPTTKDQCPVVTERELILQTSNAAEVQSILCQTGGGRGGDAQQCMTERQTEEGLDGDSSSLHPSTVHVKKLKGL